MKPEKCSFCEETTDRTSDGKLPDGWGKAKGNVLGESFDITFCPKHRKEAEGKLDIIFKRESPPSVKEFKHGPEKIRDQQMR